MSRRGVCAALVIAAMCAGPVQPGVADEARSAPPRMIPADCDRNCLYGFIDRYLDALVHRDASRLPWMANARYTENNVEMSIGDGVWGTATKLGDYKLKFADTLNGEAGFFGVIEETKLHSSGFALRLKVENHKISEAEIVILRLADFPPLTGGVNPFEKAKFEDKPILQQNLTPNERRPRERLISIADGYFDTLQLNDGTLFTEFDPNCNRFENGLQTTNNPAKPLGEMTALGCAEQFKLGNYRYDDRLRARRFPLVDEERGLVLGMGFIDHSGRLGTYKLADGRTAESPIRRPHSFCLMELFKIVDGRIRQIEAVFITVPYNMPSPWTKENP
jgi:hypothetical protein